MLDSYEAFSDIMTEKEFKHWQERKKQISIFAVLKTDMREIPYLFFLVYTIKKQQRLIATACHFLL